MEPGLALDCQGNEIVIGTAQMLSPPATGETWHVAYVNIRYAEESVDPVTTDEVAQASMTRESFEIHIEQENCNRGHRHVRARWLACGMPHPLTIAKLKHSSHGSRVDRSYRPPAVK